MEKISQFVEHWNPNQGWIQGFGFGGSGGYGIPSWKEAGGSNPENFENKVFFAMNFRISSI